MNSTPAGADDRALAPIASRGHTLRFIAVFLGVSVLLALGAARARTGPSAPGTDHAARYLGMLAFLWALWWFAWRGVRARGVSVADLVGKRWRGAGGVLVMLAVALGFLVLSHLVLGAVRQVLAGAGQDQAAESRHTLALLAPHGALERVLWVLLSASAGFCEEFVFRGYLQRQLGALAGNEVAGLVGSAVIFGLGHAYQGWRSVIVITIYGLLFGLLARISRSLLPGMIAHALEDLTSGLFPGWPG